MTLTVLSTLDAGVLAAFALLLLSGVVATAGMAFTALWQNGRARRKPVC